jgi:hypothetical protein
MVDPSWLSSKPCGTLKICDFFFLLAHEESGPFIRIPHVQLKPTLCDKARHGTYRLHSHMSPISVEFLHFS